GAVDQRFRNPDYGTISGLLKQFSPAYQQSFVKRIPPTGSEASALNSMLTNKNALAHVGISKLQLTVSDVKQYCERVIPILETLEQILL
ncbi:MAG: hypothetical protein ABIH46_09735, partial [Chloroflexota bacterium]